MNNAQTMDVQARLDRYRSFLAQDPDNPSILRELIDLEIQSGEFEAARAHLVEGLHKSPAEAGLLSRQASLALAEGRAGDAAATLQQLLDSGNEHPAVRYNLAYARSLLGEFAAVRDILQPGIDSDTASPEAHLLLARALHHLGDVGQALLQVRHYMAARPDRVEGPAHMALLYLDMEEHNLAREYAEKAFTLDKDNREALLVLGSLAVTDGQPQQAKQFLARSIELYPESGRSWSSLGLANMLELDLPQAVEALRKSVQYMPEHIGTWHALAWCQLVMGRLNEAEQSFGKAMDIDHNFGETHGGLAVVAAIKGQTETASRLAKVALRLDPESFSARYAQSVLASGTDPHKAQAMIQAIMKSQVEGSNQDLASLVSRVFSRKR